jgi:chromate transporter
MSETPSDSARPASQGPPPIPLPELFFGFARISVTGFGMILPWVRRLIVEEKGWMTAEDFNETFSFAQFLPGPNVVNLSVVFGSRIRGATGALTALAGLLGPPMLIATLLSFLYARVGDIAVLRGILSGIAAAAIGLMIAVIAKMALPLLRRPAAPAPVVLAATFLAIGVMRWPLAWTLMVLAPLSIGAAYWWQRR